MTRDLSLPDAVRDASAIRLAVGECLKRILIDRKIRLVGVRVSALEHGDEAALFLGGQEAFQ